MADFGIIKHPTVAKVSRPYARGRENSVARALRRMTPTRTGRPETTSAPTEGNRKPISLSLWLSIDPLKRVWQALEKEPGSTLYQSWIWCRAWLDTVGKSAGSEVRIIAGADDAENIHFLLPLQVRRHSGIRVLEWLGTPQITYGHGLFRPVADSSGQTWLQENWAQIIELAGPVDAVLLTEMPEAIGGYTHPLREFFNIACANRSYRMALTTDYEQLLAAKRSAETRRLYRKRERTLAAQGELSFGLPQDKAELHAVLALMFDQQEARLAERGVRRVFNPAERAFIHRIADLQDDANPVLLPYMLTYRGEIQSIMLGGLHGNTYWALISSLAASDLRKYSLGDMALRKTIEACCNRGLNSFDFAAGSADYKLHWADETISLGAVLSATNLRGLLWAMAVGLKITLRRLVKQWPLSRRLFDSARRVILGRSLKRSRP